MKRAILVSSSTVVGLVAVLTYSGADQVPALASGPSDTGAGAALGAPPAEAPSAPEPASAEASPTSTSPSPAVATTPSASAATPAAVAPTKAAAPTTAAATKAAPTKAAAPAPTKAAAPKPTPTPTPTPKPTVAVAKDYLGPVVTHKYGKVQVGIRVKAGKIIAAWAAVYPTGDSQPYTDFAIPVLKSETVKAQSSHVAAVSGATLTSKAWNTSLSSAFTKAGL